MRIGIIDLGTNSVRFDVQEIDSQRQVRRLHREKLMVRLGQGVFLHGRLDPSAAQRTIQAFLSFKQTAESLHVNKIIAFATSALREASDREQFLKIVRAQTGIALRVISGDEEARLIAQGILGGEKSLRGRLALVDIGGGSAEISVCQRGRANGGKILRSFSFGLGAARIQQVFLKSNPPKRSKNPEKDAVIHTREHVKGTLLAKFLTESWPPCSKIIGSSGTIQALAKIINRKNRRRSFERKELKRLIKQMQDLSIDELLAIPGMEPKRVDIILAGAIVLEEIMDALDAETVIPTEYALRDGILDEEKRLAGTATQLIFRIKDLESRMARLGIPKSHYQKVREIAVDLFDRLARVHKLKASWRHYLEAATILHDVGEAINPAKHSEHSYYIVKNLDIPGMKPWETDFLAELCRHHSSAKEIKGSDLPFDEPPKREAFLKILALLRIADALDRNHRGGIKVDSVAIQGQTIKLKIQGPLASDLEFLRVEQKKELFEKLFKRRLILERVKTKSRR